MYPPSCYSVIPVLYPSPSPCRSGLLSRELSRVFNGAEDSVEIAQSQPVLASMLATDAIQIGSDAVEREQ